MFYTRYFFVERTIISRACDSSRRNTDCDRDEKRNCESETTGNVYIPSRTKILVSFAEKIILRWIFDVTVTTFCYRDSFFKILDITANLYFTVKTRQKHPSRND